MLVINVLFSVLFGLFKFCEWTQILRTDSTEVNSNLLSFKFKWYMFYFIYEHIFVSYDFVSEQRFGGTSRLAGVFIHVYT